MELAEYLKEFKEIRPSIRDQWYTFWKIYRLHEHETRLQGLIEWATRKRLKQQHYYKRVLAETQVRLGDLRMRFPALSRWAFRWYWVASSLCWSSPRHAKGSAHIYRRDYGYKKPRASWLSTLVKILRG
jgi:hypothetical protein